MLRIAAIQDIEGMHKVRLSVKENILNNPSLVTYTHYVDMLTKDGIGWVYEQGQVIVGFAILDLSKNSVWALFVEPDYEGRGIGKMLHDHMIAYYFSNNNMPLWLTTSPGTRAERFYRTAGWKETGMLNGELKFELEAMTK